VELRANGSTVSVVGSLMPDKVAKIVEIDGNSVDFEPEGNFLLIGHSDMPGMIGKVGTVLGDNDINIAGMEVARKASRGPAMMILTLDDELPSSVLAKVREIPNLKSATSIRL